MEGYSQSQNHFIQPEKNIIYCYNIYNGVKYININHGHGGEHNIIAIMARSNLVTYMNTTKLHVILS